MRYLLDTNIIIAAMKGSANVRRRLEQVNASDLLLSSIVLGELELGVEKSVQKALNRQRLKDIAGKIPVVTVDEATSVHYGIIRADLERLGTPIGANDYWIAAQAIALHVILVTDNTREFVRVNGLQLENWLAES